MSKLRIRRRFVGENQFEDSDPADPREASEARNALLQNGVIAKRPGYTEVEAVTGVVRGIYNWHRADGTVDQLIVAGTRLYIYASDVLTEISSTLTSSTHLVTFLNVNDRVYFCDGSANMKVTDGTDVYNAFEYPDAYTDDIFLSTGAQSIPAGNYSFTFTFYSTTWGIETTARKVTSADVFSLSTVKQADGTYDGDRLFFEFPVARPDTRFDRIRLYMRNLDIDGSDWEFLRPMAATASRDEDGLVWSSSMLFQLDYSLVRLDPSVVAPLQLDPTAYAFRYIAEHAGVVFLAGLADNPSVIYTTEINRPWSLRGNISAGSSGASEPIRGLSSRGPALTIWKSDSIWQLTGNTPASFDAVPVVAGIGCIAQHSVVGFGEYEAFWSHGSVYIFDGTGVAEIGRPIGGRVRGREGTRDEYVVGAHDESRRQIVWSYSEDGDSANTRLLAYNYQNSGLAERPSWIPWPISGVSFVVKVIDSGGADQLWLGFTDNVAQVEGSDDDGTDIDLYWVTQRIDGGDPNELKLWKMLRVEVDAQTSTSVLRVGYILDDDPAVTWLSVDSQRTKMIARRIMRRSRDIRIVFQHAASGSVAVQGFELTAEILESR